MHIHEKYIFRCLQLALLGKGFVSPNPMVGAVLVYNNEIIGEGYHKQFGDAHAEVNCINSVPFSKQHLIKDSTLYVSLEPCNHFGKTPPCSHLIVKHNIKKVVIGCTDNYSKVNGKGIAYLNQHGIEVITNILEQECKTVNRFFFYANANKKPYIILKFAQTANGFIGNISSERLIISNAISNFQVDKWRQETDAILVGKNTAVKDNPNLTTRYHNKRKQIRIFVDDNLEVSATANLYNGKATTIVFNTIKSCIQDNIHFIQYNPGNLYNILIETCNTLGIQSILIEGGSKLLQYFIDNNWYNECYIITNNKLVVNAGIKSPILKNHQLTKQIQLQNDTISFYTNASNP